jgi:hypothetical protein
LKGHRPKEKPCWPLNKKEIKTKHEEVFLIIEWNEKEEIVSHPGADGQNDQRKAGAG